MVTEVPNLGYHVLKVIIINELLDEIKIDEITL